MFNHFPTQHNETSTKFAFHIKFSNDIFGKAYEPLLIRAILNQVSLYVSVCMCMCVCVQNES